MIKINLISEGRKPVVSRRGPSAASLGEGLNLVEIAFWGAIGVFALMAGFWFFTLSGKIKQGEEEIRKAKAEVKQLQDIIDEVERYKVRKANLEQKIDVIQQLKRNQKGPVRIMDLVSRSKPERLWFDEMTLRGSRVKIKGKAFSTNQVSTFYENLKLVPSFDEPYLRSVSKKAGGRIYSFEIDFKFSIAKPPKEVEGEGDGDNGAKEE